MGEYNLLIRNMSKKGLKEGSILEFWMFVTAFLAE
jgi:hypothetical protein